MSDRVAQESVQAFGLPFRFARRFPRIRCHLVRHGQVRAQSVRNGSPESRMGQRIPVLCDADLPIRLKNRYRALR